MKSQNKYEEDFINFCKANNLRLKKSEDGYPIAISTGKRKGDHFYEGFGDAVGVWVDRDSKRKFTHLHKKLIDLGCEPLITCDTEGTYTVPYKQAMPVAKFLRLIRGRRRGKYGEE